MRYTMSGRRFGIQATKSLTERLGFRGAGSFELANDVDLDVSLEGAGKIVARNQPIQQGAQGRARK